MAFVSFGDLAQNFLLRRDSARIDASLQRLSSELVNGRTTDLIGAVSGDLRGLSGLESSLQTAGVREVSLREATLTAETAQFALEQIAADSNTLANTLIVLDQASDSSLLDQATAEARSKFDSAVAALNVQVAGRSVFAGQSFDQPALSDATTILNDLFSVASLETTAADVLTAVDAWFAPGGAFETTHYLGSGAGQPTQLGNGETAQSPQTAIDPRIVETLKNTAIAALVDMGILSGQQTDQIDLVLAAGDRLLTSQAQIVDAQADLGIAQERISTAQTRISFEKTSLELAISEIVEVDPYEAATQLQAAEAQLRTLYEITGRLSDLTLANYLR